MKIKYFLPLFLISFFTGCLSEEEVLESALGDPVRVEDGYYQTECLIEDGASRRIYLEIFEGATKRFVQTVVYANDENCDVETDDGIESAQTTTIELASFGFENNVSFFSEGGVDLDTVRVPYHVDGNDLYLGAVEDDVEGRKPAEVFASFISSPKETARIKFTLQP